LNSCPFSYKIHGPFGVGDAKNNNQNHLLVGKGILPYVLNATCLYRRNSIHFFQLLCQGLSSESLVKPYLEVGNKHSFVSLAIPLLPGGFKKKKNRPVNKAALLGVQTTGPYVKLVPLLTLRQPF